MWVIDLHPKTKINSALFVMGILLLSPLSIVTNCWASDSKIKNITHLFDLKKGGHKALSLPTDVAVNNQYTYIVDGTNHRIVAFNHAGTFLFSFGGKKDSLSLFNYPVGIAVDGDRVYVADTGHHLVRIFDNKGNLKSSIKIFSEGEEERPIDVVVSRNGKEIYVTCNNSQKVQVYNTKGKLLRSWGKRGKRKGSFRYPATIANIGDKRKIIVDVLNARAQIFTNAGKYVRSISGQGVVAGKLFRPKGVAVDKKGRIYISDSYMDVIQVFDRLGNFLYLLGKKNKIRRFTAPAGIAIYNNRLYVAEVLANKVSVFDLR